MLLSATTEAAVDLLMQMAFGYFFDPQIETLRDAWNNVHWGRVAWAFGTGLLPGGRWVKSAVAAFGDVLFFLLEAEKNCEKVTEEEVLQEFAWSFFSEVIGDYIGDLVAEYGTKAIAKGLKKIGLDEWSEKLLRNAGYADDVTRKVADGLCSFAEGTTVMTHDGPVAIQDIRIGQEVLAFDEGTGQVGYYPVTHIWAHRDPLLVTLTVDGETIETTPEHPFYTAEGVWVAAAELRAGDRVRRADGSYGIVQAVAIVYRPQVMYNLTVAGAHTFFVGAGQWLVHNACFQQIAGKVDELVNKGFHINSGYQNIGEVGLRVRQLPNGSFEIWPEILSPQKHKGTITNSVVEDIQDLLNNNRGQAIRKVQGVLDIITGTSREGEVQLLLQALQGSFKVVKR